MISKTSILQKVTSIILMLALTWLTVSTPFVFREWQKEIIEDTRNGEDTNDEVPNPFASTTEEKTETNVNTLQEYLHDLHNDLTNSKDLLTHGKCHNMDIYLAYHGELLSPPPEA